MTTHFVIAPGRKPIPIKSLMAVLSGHLSTASELVRIGSVKAQNEGSLA
jgi:hypothetical protein